MGEALAAAAFTSLQMSLLGVVLTFANRPLYAPHALTTGPWGLTPLGDQQLAGVIMWIPGGLVLTAGVVAGLGVAMRRAGQSRTIPGHTAVAP
jgi:putative membrane protein